MNEDKTEFESPEQTSDSAMITKRGTAFPSRHGNVYRIRGTLPLHGLEDKFETHSELELDRNELISVDSDEIDAPDFSSYLVSEAA